jgi:hypothetical protein
MADRQMPTVGRAGNYAAPVDTSGMDPEMQRSLGTTVDKEPSKRNPLVAAVFKTFGMDKQRTAKTAAQKSGSVKRTSDIPVHHFSLEEGNKILGLTRNPSRTSDRPVIEKGQGIQGGAHKNTGTAGGY